jgi:hypothetical protein
MFDGSVVTVLRVVQRQVDLRGADRPVTLSD